MFGKVVFFLAVTTQVFAQEGKIFGVWQNEQFGYQMTLMLNADGSGEFDGEPIKFVALSAKLIITIGEIATTYSYNLQANQLTLSGGDLDGQVSFVRKGDTQISKGNESAKAETTRSATSVKLLGFWSGHGESLEFRADGNCVYLGQTFHYEVSQGHIIIGTSAGNATFEYSVVREKLTMKANGQSLVYTKAKGSGPMGAETDPHKNNAIPVELAGTWCYLNMMSGSQTSRCITLNADGTYLYHAEGSRSVNTETLSGGTSSQGDDRGTWSVKGDRLYYNSQTSGPGSYRLEKRNHLKNVNDPMIVLDGEPFVTATQRNPWR